MYQENVCSNPVRRAGHMSHLHCPQSRVCSAGRLCGLGRAGWQGVFPPAASSLHLVTSPSFFWKDARGGGDAAFTGDDANGAHEVCLTAFSFLLAPDETDAAAPVRRRRVENCGTRPRKMAFNFYNVLLLISQEDV